MSVLELTRGDSTAWEFTIRDSDGIPIDITAHAVAFTVKANISDVQEDAVIAVTTPTDVVLTDPTEGLCEVRLDPADTGLAPGQYVWDLQVTTPGTTVWTVASGKLLVSADVTT
jgi:hypothetical protein